MVGKKKQKTKNTVVIAVIKFTCTILLHQFIPDMIIKLQNNLNTTIFYAIAQIRKFWYEAQMSFCAIFNTMTNFSNFMIKTRQKEWKQTGEKYITNL